MDYQKIGILIANLRKEKGLTQNNLANKLGITDRAVSKWERGLGCPDISLLDDLSKIFDVSILEILKGERLESDEVLSNKSVIESINYTKESMKIKIKNYFNWISIIIIIGICLMLIFYNLRSVYYLNKTYYSNSYDILNSYSFKMIEKNMNLIKNNSGIYSENDYDIILKYINELEKVLNFENNDQLLLKEDYKYEEIIDYYQKYQSFIYFNVWSDIKKTIYGLLYQYDSNIVDNLNEYYYYNYILINYNSSFFEQLNYPYYHDKKINNDIMNYSLQLLQFKYDRENMLLEDIIKVGEINE